MKNYEQIIEFSNLNIACCDILFRKEGVYLPFFENFYPFVKENFLINYDKLLAFAKEKNTELDNNEVNFKTHVYSMSININYNMVISRLEEAKSFFA